MARNKSLEAKLAEVRERRWSEEDARVVLELLERSGDSVPAFAQAHGLNAQRLYWWRSRLSEAKERDEVGLDQLSFAPVVVTGLGRESPAMVLRLGKLELVVIEPSRVDPIWLARLLTSLEESQ